MNHLPSLRLHFVLPLLCVGGIGLFGCGDSTEPVEIRETRVTNRPTPLPPPEMPTSERLGFVPREQAQAQAGAGHDHDHAHGGGQDHAHDHGMEPAPAPAPASFEWDAPEEWETLPPTQFRVANFAFGPDGEGECYMTVLPGDGGGLAGNVNRWRDQMGLEPLSPQDLAELPRITMLGEEAVQVYMEGTYTGMAGDRHDPGYALAGVLKVSPSQSVFIKMTGLAEQVEAERENLEAFARSVEGAGGAAPAAGDSLAEGGDMPMDDIHAPFLQQQGEAGVEPPFAGQLPQAEAPSGAGPSELVDLRTAAPSALAWDIPEGWEEGPDRPMRDANFAHPESEEWECYLTVLPGPAGGAEANINRWRDQMGHAFFEPHEFAALPSITILGETGTMVEMTGDYTGLSGPTVYDARLIGAVAEFPEYSVFVKMTGPDALVEREREAFEAFCASLRFEE